MKARSKNGVLVDFSALIAHSGSTIAVGNARMNARGDILTHGGSVDRTAEQHAEFYYSHNPHAVTHTAALSSIEDEFIPSISDVIKDATIAKELETANKPRRKTTDE